MAATKTFILCSAAVLSTVVTGQDLVCTDSCVATWEACAGIRHAPFGSIMPCCSDDDHCVEKDVNFSQCRPKDRAIPSDWPSGAILTCTEPSAAVCDPETVVATLSGLSANLRVDNDAIKLDFFPGGQLDYLDSTCIDECQANDACFAFDETADADCTLFGKDLFTGGDLLPFFDAQIFLTKCFLPEPSCKLGTDEVVLLSPESAPGGGSHQMHGSSDFAQFFVTPADYALTAAVNVCRLQRTELGGCIGFAIEGTAVTLLYRAQEGTVDYRGNPDGGVYSIEGCL